ncbi:MAG TPA: hypothetical protein VEK11_05030 [Thermoanaerobaculia bacterium]|jgi:hypothetical protein|nr:hypothetical protein [Thermoanaerobaculia bacterium]
MMFRAAVAIVVLISIAAPLFAQEEAPDFSREGLQREFQAYAIELPEKPEGRRFRIRAGALEFDFLGMDWRIAYFPVLPPLPGTEQRTVIRMPDAFSLTGTEIARMPRSFHTQRAVNAELKRIAKTERAKLRVERE